MRLVVHQKGGYGDGASGTSFNREPVKPTHWGGNWDEYFRKQKHPIFWRLVKLLKR